MTSTLTYNFQNYQVLIYKEDEQVHIYVYDKKLSTNSSKSFTNEDVMKLNMTLDIFYDIMIKVFNTSYYNTDDKSSVHINTTDECINLIIYCTHWVHTCKEYKFYSEFMFELSLNNKYKLHKLQKKNKDIKLKKKLKKEINKLKTFINDHMELTINEPFQLGTNYNIRYSIKLNTPIINIINGHSNKFMRYQNNELDLPTYSQTKYNNNFKLIKCHTLKISNMSNTNFNYNNLPESITTLIITGDTSEQHFKELYLPNLETIVLNSCPYIVTLYSSIMHLKSLKNVKIVNCMRFIEKDLLVEQGYNFI